MKLHTAYALMTAALVGASATAGTFYRQRNLAYEEIADFSNLSPAQLASNIDAAAGPQVLNRLVTERMDPAELIGEAVRQLVAAGADSDDIAAALKEGLR